MGASLRTFGEFFRRLPGNSDAGKVALHIRDENGGTGGRDLLRDELQSLCFAGAGSAGNQTVPIEHSEWHVKRRFGVRLAAIDDRAEMNPRLLKRVGGNEVVRVGLRDVGHEVGAPSRWVS